MLTVSEFTGIGAVNGTGNELANRIVGNELSNSLVGGAGNDTLDGGNGIVADTLVGGTGNDVYHVGDDLDVVVENAGEGIDKVYASLDYTLGANIENLALISAVSGTGNALANTITGNTRDNVLNGGAGTDTLIGGQGNDSYYVDSTLDVVTEAAGEGTDDVVYASAFYTLSANVENLVLIGTTVSGAGNALDNKITGNGSNNVLNGGAGADTLTGGLGNDSYYVDSDDDVIGEKAGEGSDSVFASVDWTLQDNIEILNLQGSAIRGTGNDLANQIVGNAAANVLNGGAGADRLIGGAGADTLVGGTGNDVCSVDDANDVVVENAGEGTDTVNASVNWTLGANLENLTLEGTAVSGTGNALGNRIAGNGFDNILYAGDGTDMLTGGAGADQFVLVNQTSGRDTIVDFTIGSDKVVLSGFGLEPLQAGYNYSSNGGPTNATPTVLYNTATGILSFDMDGTGASAAVEIGLLTTKPTLSISDFILI